MEKWDVTIVTWGDSRCHESHVLSICSQISDMHAHKGCVVLFIAERRLKVQPNLEMFTFCVKKNEEKREELFVDGQLDRGHITRDDDFLWRCKVNFVCDKS